MKLIFTTLLLLNSLTLSAEWVSLFDGKTLNGWTLPEKKTNWSVTEGAITADKGPASLLLSEKKYANFELELEFKAALGTNSGVFLNMGAKVKNVATDCYEINIADPSNPFPTGSIVQRIKVEGLGESETWRSYHLKFVDGTVTVTLDGKKLYEYVSQPARPAGFIGLQKNKGAIAFRKIRLRVLE